MSQKTLEPTPQKLREARQKGQLARSRLFGTAAATFGGLAGTLAFAPATTRSLRSFGVSMLSLKPMRAPEALGEAASVLATCAAPTLLGALCASLAAAVVTAGGVEFNAALLSPSLERINPKDGLARLLGPKQFFEILRGLLVATVVAALLWRVAREAAPSAFRIVSHDGARGLGALLSIMGPAVLRVGAVLLVLGIGDWALARFRHRRELRMSREEQKQEFKNSEGDPHHKAKRKSVHRQLASGGSARGVQKATAVVVNPTHIAVALRYDEAECDAPYIVAKGREEDALNLRNSAEQHDIPIVKDVMLARSLVHYDVGEEVPEELYQAAAAVLKVAFEQSQARDTFGKGALR